MKQCCRISEKLKYSFCSECGLQLKEIESPKYKIFRGLRSLDFVKTDLKFEDIKFLYALLDEKHLKKTGYPEHGRNCFLQDIGHDWHIYRGGIKITLGGDQKELVDILIELT